MRDRRRHTKYPVGNSTLYKIGCSLAVLQHVVSVGSWVCYSYVTLTGLTVVFLVACRYLQTSISDAVHDGNELLPSHGYLLSYGRRRAPGTRAPPPTPATQTPSPRSPAKVAGKADAKQRRRRRGNRNKSNIQANNSAALVDLVDVLSDNPEQWSVNSDLELIAERLASLSLSNRIQLASSEPSSGRTTSDLPPPTIVQPANDTWSAPGEVSAVHSPLSPNPSVASSSFSHSSPVSNLQDNWNSNARIDSNSPRSVRTTQSSSVVADRNNDNPPISRGRIRIKTRKYRGRFRSQPRSTSRSDRQNVVNPPRPSRVKDRSYRPAEKTAEDRNHRSSSSEDTSINRSNVGGSATSTLQHVKRSDRMKTHRVKDHRHIQPEHGIHYKQSYHASGLVPHSFDHLPQASRKKTLLHSLSTGRVGPVMRSLGSPQTHIVEGRSSEWSTVSCHTVGRESLTGSERSSKSVKRREHLSQHVSHHENSTAALLALSDYLGTGRSNKCSKVVQKCSTSTDNRASLEARKRQTRELSGRSKTGRTSNNSWSTVSCQTLSRPPSSEFHGEVVVDDERASCSASKQMRQANNNNSNNNCNSPVNQSTSFRVAPSPKIRRRLSQELQHLDSDELSSSATTSSWTVGQTSCDGHSNTIAGPSASVKQLTETKYRKLSNKWKLSPSLVHAVVDAIQLHLDASAPNTTPGPDRTWLDSTMPHYHPGLASSNESNKASVRERQQSAD